MVDSSAAWAAPARDAVSRADTAGPSSRMSSSKYAGPSTATLPTKRRAWLLAMVTSTAPKKAMPDSTSHTLRPPNSWSCVRDSRQGTPSRVEARTVRASITAGAPRKVSTPLIPSTPRAPW